MTREIKLLINKSEITAGTRGASLGPEAIMAAARKASNAFFGHHEIQILPDMNHYLDQEIRYPLAKRIGGLLHVFEGVSAAIQGTISEGKFPVLLSGDHGSAGGTMAGLKAAYPDKRLGVIWIDAHADIHTPFTTPSGNMHGMPLATALGLDNLEERANEPSEEIIDLWQRLKNVGIEGRKLEPQDLVYIAVRDTEPQEDAIIDRLNIVNHTVEVVRSKGVDAVIQMTLDQLKDCDLLYISFDVDSMDPAQTSYGTGTPVKNGLLPKEAEQMLSILAREKRTACIEFVEINPCLDDRQNRMAEIAFGLLETTVYNLNK